MITWREYLRIMKLEHIRIKIYFALTCMNIGKNTGLGLPGFSGGLGTREPTFP